MKAEGRRMSWGPLSDRGRAEAGVRWWKRKTVWLAVGVCVVVGGALLARAVARRARSVEALVRELREEGPYGRYGVVERTLDGAEMYGVANWFASERGVVGDLIAAGAAAVGPLVPVLGDGDEDIRDAAKSVMGAIDDPRVVDELIEALGDANPLVRAGAAEVLGRKKDMRAAEGLAGAVRDEDADVRRVAVWALGCLDKGLTVAALAAALADGRVEVRIDAIHALRDSADARAVAPMRAALGDEDALVRIEAVWGVAVLEGGRAEEALAALLGDEDARVRENVAWAIVKKGGSGAREMVRKAVRERDGAIVAGGHKLVIAMGEAGSEDALINALNRPEVVWAAPMVQSFLFCGNAKLAEAARAWVKKDERWAVEEFSPPAEPVKWGSEGGKDEG